MRPAIALVLLAATACSSARSAGPTPGEPGLEVEGLYRTYQWYVPPTLDRTRPAPVLFAFHGAGSSIEDLRRGTGLDALADREGWVVVYPRGRGARFDVATPGGPDVLLVPALLERLRTEVAVDPTRIHATGFSNGAMLCYRLAADLPHLFASIAPVGAVLPTSARPSAQTRVSLLHVHGSADRVVPAAGRPGGLGAAAAVDAWARALGCRGPSSERAVPEALPTRATLRDHPCGPGRAASLLWVEGAGHQWPGGADGWLTRHIGRFFRAHPRGP